MLRNVALASSVVASMPIVVPLTSPASASRCSIEVRVVKHAVQAPVGRVRRTARQVLSGNPRGRLLWAADDAKAVLNESAIS